MRTLAYITVALIGLALFGPLIAAGLLVLLGSVAPMIILAIIFVPLLVVVSTWADSKSGD